MVFDPVEQARAKRALVMVLIATVIVASIEFWINYIWNPTTNVPREASKHSISYSHWLGL